MASKSQFIQKLSILSIAILETNLITHVNGLNFFDGSALNTVLVVIIIIALLVIVVLAGILIYLWWKRQMAEADSVKQGFSGFQKKRKENDNAAEMYDEKKDELDDETPGQIQDTPGNEEDMVYMAKLAADKEKLKQKEANERMNENRNVNRGARNFGNQLKDKQVGQKMVETDIVAQMHDDKTNTTPGHTPGYTPGSDRFVR